MSAGARGYFGGTFDPPHLGHIILASEAIYQLGLEQINWIITPDPPHKKERVITPQEHRLEMLKRVIDRYQGFNISEVDLRRPPPHYAADTVEILKDQDPDHELVYLIGEDSLCDLPDWHQPDRFLSKVDQLAVYSRTGYQADLDQIELILPSIKNKVRYIDGIEIQISSSMIRKRAAEGNAYKHFLIREVAEYIQNKSLYTS